MCTSDPHAATTRQSLLGLIQNLSTCMGTLAASALSCGGKTPQPCSGDSQQQHLPEINQHTRLRPEHRLGCLAKELLTHYWEQSPQADGSLVYFAFRLHDLCPRIRIDCSSPLCHFNKYSSVMVILGSDSTAYLTVQKLRLRRLRN